MCKSFFILFFSIFVAAELGANDIWIEGESSDSSTMKSHPWYSDNIKKSELSGGEFLSHFSSENQPQATFKFDVSSGGDYTFWVRMNPVANPKASFQLNSGQWENINFSNAGDKRNIAKDGKPDMRYIAWIKIGKVKLEEGLNILKFKFFSDNNNFGSLDCFYLSQTDYTPNGKKKPGVRIKEEADEGMWTFDPDFDTFSNKSMLDLTFLNKPIKNSDPFITVDNNGDFVKGNQSIRFWALNTYTQNTVDFESMKRYGRWLAKRGVNMVRWHGHLPTDNIKSNTRLEEVDQKELNNCFKLVAAMKANGIYTCLSPYWGSHTKNKKSWGLSHIDNDTLAAVVFWDKKVQNAYKKWLKALYTTKNPYTGIALKDDPAVAVIQYQNEDSILFYTMQKVKGQVREDLKKLYGDFVKQKYGTFDVAYKVWDNKKLKGDELDSGKLDLVLVWELTQHRSDKGFEQRKSDQLEFYTKLMRSFNEQMADYLRNELGCKQLINAGNWRTADDLTMLDSERYAYDANEVIGCNRYKSSIHHGPKSGYLIMPGDSYANQSVLKKPDSLPVSLKQVKGKAMIIPESTWVPPEKYQSEGPLLTAAYSSLNGVDTLFWFSHGKEEWEIPFGKWSAGTPMIIGQFPAAALMYRMGYVERGKPVVIEKRSLDKMWAREKPLISESMTYDPNRDKTDNTDMTVDTLVNPLAFLVGPVEVVYDAGLGKSYVADLSRYINKQNKTVKSNTDQLELNYGKGIFTLRTPKAQAASGWLSKAGIIKLGDVMIKTDNEYSTISVVSMDDQPIKKSNQILVQIGTYARPLGFKITPTKIKRKNSSPVDGFKINDTGQSIWNIEKAKGIISISNPNISKGYVLNANGMPVKNIQIKRDASRIVFKLPEDSLYIMLK